MTESAGDNDVGSLSDRLAHALGGDSSVRLAWLHGSRARGTARRESDIDVAVLLDDECAASPSAIKDSIWRLAGALGREVPSDRLDLVLLNHAPALLRHRVIRDGAPLFARSDAERVGFVLRTIREYQDLEPRLREHTRRRVERLKERRSDGRTESFSRRLDALESYLGRLRSLGDAAEPDYLAEPGIHDLAARYLHLAVEAAIDLANHRIADQGLRTPDSNRDSFSVLEEAGEIEAALAERMRGWAGFRNVLVHDYIGIDHRIAYAVIRDELDELAEFRIWALGKIDP